ncbi:hypothetical protein DITRI_Ditri04bG0012200 [Diplodiscus trichospermus]
MANPSLPSIQLNSPTTIAASIKQEPLPSLLSFPPPELIPQPPQSQQQQQQQQTPPQFLKSVNDLSFLSSKINALKCRLDDLTKHFDFIKEAIDSKLNELQEEQRQQIGTQPPPISTETENERSQIESICEKMRSKGLRRYIINHLTNVPKLREDIPAALKLAPEPAKLVLDCIGRFFLQGIMSYTRDTRFIPIRQASVLLLEFFLLMMGGFPGEGDVKIAADLKVEAEERAVAWRDRLIGEGSLARTNEVDARGLLLFVACFGIPEAFQSEDLGNLLHSCDLRSISDALKGSPMLLHKMPDIIETMVKNEMHIEAVDVASILGLEDKCSPKAILTFFLQESTKEFERAKREAQNCPFKLREAKEDQLDALESVLHYLKGRSGDVTKLLGSWQIQEKIFKLEEEIAELNQRIEDRKMIPKRNLDEMGSSSSVHSQEMKRSRLLWSGHGCRFHRGK